MSRPLSVLEVLEARLDYVGDRSADAFADR
jgi:hypothetical protein